MIHVYWTGRFRGETTNHGKCWDFEDVIIDYGDGLFDHDWNKIKETKPYKYEFEFFEKDSEISCDLDELDGAILKVVDEVFKKTGIRMEGFYVAEVESERYRTDLIWQRITEDQEEPKWVCSLTTANTSWIEELTASEINQMRSDHFSKKE